MKETKRPALYRSLKYWGKKPHNIWATLIAKNTNFGDVVYDPFAGSALTFFESVRIGRKPIIVDINPLTLFLVTVYSQQFDFNEIRNRYYEVEKIVVNSDIYRKNYLTKCQSCGCYTDIYNYRWENGKPTHKVYKCKKCNDISSVYNDMFPWYENSNFWKPNLDIHDFTSVCNASIKHFGGNNISNIWSNRNLEILSLIFDLVLKSDASVKDALVFAFLQILHLTTKMCASRSFATKRPLSTSWGRPAFMYLNKHMEQNPLIQFRRAIFEKNGVINALKSKEEYLPKYSFSQRIEDIDKVDGVVIIGDSRKLDVRNVDFVITDPPYGPVIQYGELSTIWNVWLEHYDTKYRFDLSNEIIISKKNTRTMYTEALSDVLRKCRSALKKEKGMVLTFNSNDEKDWNSLKIAIDTAGLKVVKKCKQENRRSSEADVLKSTQLSINDYYLVLEKEREE